MFLKSEKTIMRSHYIAKYSSFIPLNYDIVRHKSHSMFMLTLEPATVLTIRLRYKSSSCIRQTSRTTISTSSVLWNQVLLQRLKQIISVEEGGGVDLSHSAMWGKTC
jgi:hypothetical protein